MGWHQQDPKDSMGQNTRPPKQEAAKPKLDVPNGIEQNSNDKQIRKQKKKKTTKDKHARKNKKNDQH